MANTHTKGQEKVSNDTKVRETLNSLDSLMKIRSGNVKNELDDKKKDEEETSELGGLAGWEGTF